LQPDRGDDDLHGGEPFGRYVLWGRPGFLAKVLQAVEAHQGRI